MGNIAISVENLGKKYRIGAMQHRHDTLREALVARFRRDGRPKDDEILWALRHVSLEVPHGEVLGMIGRNGAGKSTLLKILSRITEPTEGEAVIHGRVGSLLEVGTGFHPELTGRENTYLSGAVLGMTRAEIESKFDEIVAFSEIERFIDTPVKRYSSGMYVRLAFAVAAHLDPEILLIDEVLSVGDAAFQKKCLGKMGDAASEGRTVVFVSHNMVAVQSLCERVIRLDQGNMVQEGHPRDVVLDYLEASYSSPREQVWDSFATAPGNEKVRLHRIAVRPTDGTSGDPITMQGPFVVEVDFLNLIPGKIVDITLRFHNERGIHIFSTGSGGGRAEDARTVRSGFLRRVCHVPANLLNSGVHRVGLLVVEDRSRVIYRHEDAVSFDVFDTGENRGGWYGKSSGAVRPVLKWTTEQLKYEGEPGSWRITE